MEADDSIIDNFESSNSDKTLSSHVSESSNSGMEYEISEQIGQDKSPPGSVGVSFLTSNDTPLSSPNACESIGKVSEAVQIAPKIKFSFSSKNRTSKEKAKRKKSSNSQLLPSSSAPGPSRSSGLTKENVKVTSKISKKKTKEKEKVTSKTLKREMKEKETVTSKMSKRETKEKEKITSKISKKEERTICLVPGEKFKFRASHIKSLSKKKLIICKNVPDLVTVAAEKFRERLLNKIIEKAQHEHFVKVDKLILIKNIPMDLESQILGSWVRFHLGSLDSIIINSIVIKFKF